MNQKGFIESPLRSNNNNNNSCMGTITTINIQQYQQQQRLLQQQQQQQQVRQQLQQQKQHRNTFFFHNLIVVVICTMMLLQQQQQRCTCPFVNQLFVSAFDSRSSIMTTTTTLLRNHQPSQQLSFIRLLRSSHNNNNNRNNNMFFQSSSSSSYRHLSILESSSTFRSFHNSRGSQLQAKKRNDDPNVVSTKSIMTPTPTFVGRDNNENENDNTDNDNLKIINLSTVERSELEMIVMKQWNYPKYRVEQIWDWIRTKGITNPNEMKNLPKPLIELLMKYTKPSALKLVYEMISKDGTIKRAYSCYDNQIIESVLMPYGGGSGSDTTDGNDGGVIKKYTACISSQAGCAQGCVFCATGQMGYVRQLTSDEIFEQVARFANELLTAPLPPVTSQSKQSTTLLNGQQIQNRKPRLSNVVFMGMGEPLANYRHVVHAVNRITNELGIGARRITVSTVGIVPNIRKLISDPNVPPIRLAVSLHCATDEERNLLLPANRRFGGLYPLLCALNEYITITGRRVTLEWALIEGKNDTPEVARQLGRLLTSGGNAYDVLNPQDTNVYYPKLRRDMLHVNVIPLNPTSQYNGSPSQRNRVENFMNVLNNEFRISCTPRMRRGIDIDAGCGQLKAKVVLLQQKKEQVQEGQQQQTDTQSITSRFDSSDTLSLQDFMGEKNNNNMEQNPTFGVYEDDNDDDDDDNENENESHDDLGTNHDIQFHVNERSIDLDEDHQNDNDNNNNDTEDDDSSFSTSEELTEVQRLIGLVKGTTIDSSKL